MFRSRSDAESRLTEKWLKAARDAEAMRPCSFHPDSAGVLLAPYAKKAGGAISFAPVQSDSKNLHKQCRVADRSQAGAKCA
jgi:hypothetical protein